MLERMLPDRRHCPIHIGFFLIPCGYHDRNGEFSQAACEVRPISPMDLKSMFSHSEQIEAAEARMSAARDALLTCVEKGLLLDQEQYRRLVARVKKTEAEFLKIFSELDG
jgi:hypothetical protein